MSSLAYTVRRSARARRARVQVTLDGVEVVVPHRFALREVEQLLLDKRRWIERTQRRLMESQVELPPARLEDGGEVPYLGERLALRVAVEPDRRRPYVSRRGGTVHAVIARPGSEAVKEALEQWYRRRARVEVGERLTAAAARAGRSFGALQIRGQRTRWASCSPSGTMSFNWRLLLAPREILDYVVEHELAHLEVPDHSPSFWELLAGRRPAYREEERWLRRHGHALRL